MLELLPDAESLSRDAPADATELFTSDGPAERRVRAMVESSIPACRTRISRAIRRSNRRSRTVPSSLDALRRAQPCSWKAGSKAGGLALEQLSRHCRPRA